MAHAERGTTPENSFSQQTGVPLQAHAHEHTPARETPVVPRPVFSLPDIIADIQAHADALTHEERTRELLNTPEQVVIVSGYQPGEGEDLHAHPTQNTLLFLAGVFDLWVVNHEGMEEHYEVQPGTMVGLQREQPHRVQARADQEGLAIVMVTIVEGMSTSTPGYSIPVHNSNQ